MRKVSKEWQTNLGTKSHTPTHTYTLAHTHTTLSNTNLCTIGDSREQSAATDRHYLPTNRHSNYILHCFGFCCLVWFGSVCFYLLVVLNSLFLLDIPIFIASFLFFALFHFLFRSFEKRETYVGDIRKEH